MPAWIMSSKVVRSEGITFYIGAAPVAQVNWVRPGVVLLHFLGENHGPFARTADAMHEMHRLLKAPAPEGAKVGRGARRLAEDAATPRS